MTERTEITKHGVKLTINKPSTDEARVSAFESALGCRLPDDYREFLLRHNGGQPHPASFQFALRKGPGTSSSVEWFLSLHDGKFSNLEQKRKIYDGRVPRNTVPIATDAFGNVILLGIRGDAQGRVYFWDHEEEPESQPDWSNVDLLANNFDEFIAGLRES
jgi:cell wall assembly regulator SMI1